MLKLKKNKFYRNKIPVHLRDVDTEIVLVSLKISFGEKNYKFISYLYNDSKVEPLHIMLPKTSTYVKSYDGQTKTKWIYFLIEDDNLLEKYSTIWDKVSGDIKKRI